MADRLYLSLWYPNFRLESLPAALIGVLRQFSLVGGKRVAAASAYPINFTEPPTYQRIYVDPAPTGGFDPASIDTLPGASDAQLEAAVAEAAEQLHDDMAYEFEMRWQLWALEEPDAAYSRLDDPPRGPGAQAHDPDFDPDPDEPAFHNPDTPWKLRTHTVRILGFGPHFDVAGYEQNGHLLIDFGLDTPWVLDLPLDDQPLDEEAQLHIQQNVEKLLAFTLLIEKNCGISSRLLWTESGEPLADKLIARLQRVN
jgi:hypothetical protein